MGGVGNQLRENEAKFGVLGNLGIVKSGKKKKKRIDPQAQKNLAAKSAAPLLQQTALTPESKPTGTGTALL